jgi:hypothetical protein
VRRQLRRAGRSRVGVVDPNLINGIIEHARHRPTSELIFSPARCAGLSGVLLRPELLERLNVSLV